MLILTVFLVSCLALRYSWLIVNLIISPQSSDHRPLIPIGISAELNTCIYSWFSSTQLILNVIIMYSWILRRIGTVQLLHACGYILLTHSRGANALCFFLFSSSSLVGQTVLSYIYISKENEELWVWRLNTKVPVLSYTQKDPNSTFNHKTFRNAAT